MLAMHGPITVKKAMMSPQNDGVDGYQVFKVLSCDYVQNAVSNSRQGLLYPFPIPISFTHTVEYIVLETASYLEGFLDKDCCELL
jgi:hypothetical protein